MRAGVADPMEHRRLSDPWPVLIVPVLAVEQMTDKQLRAVLAAEAEKAQGEQRTEAERGAEDHGGLQVNVTTA